MTVLVPPSIVSLPAAVVVPTGSNVTFTVLASPDLVQWTPILTNQTLDGVYPFSDPDPAVVTKRFYRAVLVP